MCLKICGDHESWYQKFTKKFVVFSWVLVENISCQRFMYPLFVCLCFFNVLCVCVCVCVWGGGGVCVCVCVCVVGVGFVWGGWV